MNRWILTAAAACATGSALAAPGPRAAALTPPPLSGFVEGFRQELGGNLIVEHVPTGESVHRWTRMVTVQRIAGAGARMSPSGHLQNMIYGLARACPSGRAGVIRSLVVANRSAAEFRADCPRNPGTGQPETFVVRTIAQGQDLHVVQVAFRRVPSALDLSWARTVLDRTQLN
jgi:hypothetical protein